MPFEFDPDKSAGNKVKHGIDFVAAQALWKPGNLRLRRFANTVDGQVRYAVIGYIGKTLYTAIITYIGAVIRIISVRPANSDETERYEQAIKKE